MKLMALRHIQHDHQEYNAGDLLPEMPESQAQQLLAGGAAEVMADEAEASEEKPKSKRGK